ncbi:Ig-like domain repeat protein [Pseudolysobacter antarcticus]|uniref:Ig-like domain repeat protein n=2 Tax=Pseudolysobacter antarcticus TaxID=2511995 RepID=A0A411HQ05_9GAMM|nr:Ig-like domain repeat protein [Pseudolysobacter antarcticus]
MLGAGTCILAADQAGNVNYAAATQASQAVTIAKATTTTALTTACMTTFVGNQPFTTLAVVTGSSPTGKVTFNQGASALCSNVILNSGSASCTTSTLATIGADTKDSYNLTASYSGDAQNAASVSAPLSVTVLRASDVVYRNGFEAGTLTCPIE